MEYKIIPFTRLGLECHLVVLVCGGTVVEYGTFLSELGAVLWLQKRGLYV